MSIPERGTRDSATDGQESPDINVIGRWASWSYYAVTATGRLASHYLDLLSDVAIMWVGLVALWPLVSLYLLLWIGGHYEHEETG